MHIWMIKYKIQNKNQDIRVINKYNKSLRSMEWLNYCIQMNMSKNSKNEKFNGEILVLRVMKIFLWLLKDQIKNK